LDAATPLALCNPQSSLGSHFRGCASSPIGCSCQSYSSPRIERCDSSVLCWIMFLTMIIRAGLPSINYSYLCCASSHRF
jgi:hypothetical protein